MASDLRLSSPLSAACSNSCPMTPTTASLSLPSSRAIHPGIYSVAGPEVSTLWEGNNRDGSTQTAKITVDRIRPLTVDDIVAQLRSQGFEVHKDSPVTVEGIDDSMNATPVASNDPPDNRSSSSPSAITLKDLPKLLKGIIAWEVIKRISIKLDQYLLPIALRWRRRRQIRAMLARPLPDP